MWPAPSTEVVVPFVGEDDRVGRRAVSVNFPAAFDDQRAGTVIGVESRFSGDLVGAANDGAGVDGQRGAVTDEDDPP